MNILVIENEQFLAENLYQYLKTIENLRIEYVTNAQRALQLLSQQRYDLVIADLWLPDVTSDDWLLEIGAISPGQSLIVTSSYPVPRYLTSSNTVNIIGYFEKPFDMKIIVNLINQLIKHKE